MRATPTTSPGWSSSCSWAPCKTCAIYGPQCARASALSLEQLAELADANDRAAARSSLDAELRHWRSGEALRARDWLAAELQAMAPLALDLGVERWLAPLEDVLQRGNQAQQWLAAQAGGASVAELIAAGAAAMEQREIQLAALLETDRSTLLG